MNKFLSSVIVLRLIWCINLIVICLLILCMFYSRVRFPCTLSLMNWHSFFKIQNDQLHICVNFILQLWRRGCVGLSAHSNYSRQLNSISFKWNEIGMAVIDHLLLSGIIIRKGVWPRAMQVQINWKRSRVRFLSIHARPCVPISKHHDELPIRRKWFNSKFEF